MDNENNNQDDILMDDGSIMPLKFSQEIVADSIKQMGVIKKQHQDIAQEQKNISKVIKENLSSLKDFAGDQGIDIIITSLKSRLSELNDAIASINTEEKLNLEARHNEPKKPEEKDVSKLTDEERKEYEASIIEYRKNYAEYANKVYNRTLEYEDNTINSEVETRRIAEMVTLYSKKGNESLVRLYENQKKLDEAKKLEEERRKEELAKQAEQSLLNENKTEPIKGNEPDKTKEDKEKDKKEADAKEKEKEDREDKKKKSWTKMFFVGIGKTFQGVLKTAISPVSLALQGIHGLVSGIWNSRVMGIVKVVGMLALIIHAFDWIKVLINTWRKEMQNNFSKFMEDSFAKTKESIVKFSDDISEMNFDFSWDGVSSTLVDIFLSAGNVLMNFMRDSVSYLIDYVGNKLNNMVSWEKETLDEYRARRAEYKDVEDDRITKNNMGDVVNARIKKKTGVHLAKVSTSAQYLNLSNREKKELSEGKARSSGSTKVLNNMAETYIRGEGAEVTDRKQFFEMYNNDPEFRERVMQEYSKLALDTGVDLNVASENRYYNGKDSDFSYDRISGFMGRQEVARLERDFLDSTNVAKETEDYVLRKFLENYEKGYIERDRYTDKYVNDMKKDMNPKTDVNNLILSDETAMLGKSLSKSAVEYSTIRYGSSKDKDKEEPVSNNSIVLNNVNQSKTISNNTPDSFIAVYGNPYLIS